MSKQCEVCGKTKMNGKKIVRDAQGILGRNTVKREINLQSVTVENDKGTPCKMKVCTRCLKKMKSDK